MSCLHVFRLDTSLHWADYVIFISFFGISLAIGVYFAFSGGRQRSVEEFLVANHQLSVVPTVMSLVMSYLSALTILGGVAEMYTHGVYFYCWYFVGFMCAMITVERMIVPWLFPLRLVSVYEVGSFHNSTLLIKTINIS